MNEAWLAPVRKKPDIKPGVNADMEFFYHREKRLEKATKGVQDLYSGKLMKKSVSQRLFGKRSNIYIFVTIVVVSFVLTWQAGISDNEINFKLGENDIALSISALGDSRDAERGGVLMLFMKKTAKKASAYAGEVDIVVSPVLDKDDEGAPDAPPIEARRFFFTHDSPESYSMTLPFSGKRFIVIIQTENERLIKRISL
jgi:hypothetical protein